VIPTAVAGGNPNEPSATTRGSCSECSDKGQVTGRRKRRPMEGRSVRYSIDLLHLAKLLLCDVSCALLFCETGVALATDD
jgi:hypothetical protein